jgi:hypothetical protein
MCVRRRETNKLHAGRLRNIKREIPSNKEKKSKGGGKLLEKPSGYEKKGKKESFAVCLHESRCVLLDGKRASKNKPSNHQTTTNRLRRRAGRAKTDSKKKKGTERLKDRRSGGDV